MLSCPGSPVFTALSWLSFTNCSFLAALSCLSFLAILFVRSCLGCPFLVILFFFPVLAVLLWLSCSCCPGIVTEFRLGSPLFIRRCWIYVGVEYQTFVKSKIRYFNIMADTDLASTTLEVPISSSIWIFNLDIRPSGHCTVHSYFYFISGRSSGGAEAWHWSWHGHLHRNFSIYWKRCRTYSADMCHNICGATAHLKRLRRRNILLLFKFPKKDHSTKFLGQFLSFSFYYSNPCGSGHTWLLKLWPGLPYSLNYEHISYPVYSSQNRLKF